MIGLVKVVIEQTCMMKKGVAISSQYLSCMFGPYTEQISQISLEYYLAIKQHPLHILWGFYFRSNFAKVYKINKQAHDHAIITA